MVNVDRAPDGRLIGVEIVGIDTLEQLGSEEGSPAADSVPTTHDSH